VKQHSKIFRALVTTRSITVCSAICLLTLGWIAVFPLTRCPQCDISATLSQLHAWFVASVPDSIRVLAWTIFKWWPSVFIGPFLDPFLYVAIAAIAVCEVLLPAEEGRRLLSSGTIQDFFWFATHKFLQVILIGVMLQGLHELYDSHLSFLSIHSLESWPLAFKVIGFILVYDFLDWFHHLLRHKVWFFWCFHSVHHSQRHINLFTEDRVHPIDEIVAICLIFIPLFMFRMEQPFALYLALFAKWYPHFVHANIKTDLGWLKYVLVTPQSHRVHHSIEERHRDRNFGVLFSVWDRMFGTMYSNTDEYPSTGVPDAKFPIDKEGGRLAVVRNYVSQLVYPFKIIRQKSENSRFEIEGSRS
jgi:sterol desaturase/sphingolipid hydroxylase (fatty acid hydroxylase superfamily)